jgi:hypothetical protein
MIEGLQQTLAQPLMDDWRSLGDRLLLLNE